MAISTRATLRLSASISASMGLSEDSWRRSAVLPQAQDSRPRHQLASSIVGKSLSIAHRSSHSWQTTALTGVRMVTVEASSTTVVLDPMTGVYMVPRELEDDPPALIGAVANLLADLPDSIPQHPFFTSGLCLDANVCLRAFRNAKPAWESYTTYIAGESPSDDSGGSGEVEVAYCHLLTDLIHSLEREVGEHSSSGADLSMMAWVPGSPAAILRDTYNTGMADTDSFRHMGAAVVHEGVALAFLTALMKAVETLRVRGDVKLTEKEVHLSELQKEVDKEHARECLQICYQIGGFNLDKAVRVLDGALHFQQGYIHFLDKISEECRR